MEWWWRLVKYTSPSAIFGTFKFDKPPHSLHTFSVDLNGYFKKYILNFTVKSEKSKQLNAIMESDVLDSGWACPQA